MGETRVHPLMRDRAGGLPAAVDLPERAASALDTQNWRATEAALEGVLVLAPGCAEALRTQGVMLHLRDSFAAAVAMSRSRS